MNKFNGFILKAFQLALVADQAYEATQATGAGAGDLLHPQNFNALLLELGAVFAPTQSAAPLAAGSAATGGLTVSRPIG